MARFSDFLEYENSKECCPLISEYIKRIWEKIPSKREMMDSACGYFNKIYPGSGDLYVDSLNMMNKFDPEVLFRGQSNAEYEIIPRLGRNSNFIHEKEFIEIPQTEKPDFFKPGYRPLEKLALLQHYGIPTRLLDVTSNLLVALFFACQSDNGKNGDGEIILFFDMHSYSSIYPLMEAHADSYSLTEGRCLSLDAFYERAFRKPYFSDEQYKSLYLNRDNQIRGFLHPVVVNPPRRALRHQAQQGKFLLFPNEIKQNPDSPYIEASIAKIEKDSPFCRCLKICGEHKKELLSELSILGVDKVHLFPDNVDVFSSEIVRNLTNRQTCMRGY